jgi:hypothetical protein
MDMNAIVEAIQNLGLAAEHGHLVPLAFAAKRSQVCSQV